MSFCILPTNFSKSSRLCLKYSSFLFLLSRHLFAEALFLILFSLHWGVCSSGGTGTRGARARRGSRALGDPGDPEDPGDPDPEDPEDPELGGVTIVALAAAIAAASAASAAAAAAAVSAADVVDAVKHDGTDDCGLSEPRGAKDDIGVLASRIQAGPALLGLAIFLVDLAGLGVSVGLSPWGPMADASAAMTDVSAMGCRLSRFCRVDMGSWFCNGSMFGAPSRAAMCGMIVAPCMLIAACAAAEVPGKGKEYLAGASSGLSRLSCLASWTCLS